MQETITNLKSIYTALDTLHITGHQQTKTYTNCMDLLMYTINQIATTNENNDTITDSNDNGTNK